MVQLGMMSDADIREAIQEKELCITPFDVNDSSDMRLTPVGFNFSFSRFVVSLNQKAFYQIHEENDQLYFCLEPGDTAIALTQESIWVSKYIGGTFHSKVGYVILGLGHISTTLDPYWQGQLLISLNNPSKRKIKVVIAKYRSGKWIYSTFITLCLYRMGSPASKPSDNSCARLDTLYKLIRGGDRTKKQKQVVSTVREMLTFMSNQKDNILSQKESVGEEDIELFISNHNEILTEWDKKYPIIQALNSRVLFAKKIKHLLPWIVITAFIIGLSIIAYLRLDEKNFLVTMLSFFAAVVGGIITLLWNKKDG